MTQYDVQVRKFHKELSAGTVSLALLAVLATAGEPMYGYQIAKRLERAGQDASNAGKPAGSVAVASPAVGSAAVGSVLVGKQSALYPVLRNLSAAGLLDSHVEPSDAGPPRRYYRINATGQGVLREWTVAWRATRDSVDSVLEGLTP